MRGAGKTGRGNHSLIPHPEPENEASTGGEVALSSTQTAEEAS